VIPAEEESGMNYYFKGSLVVGLVGTLVYSEVQGESHPHAQYITVSPTNNLLASGGYVSNVAASTATYTYHPSPIALEHLLPHERLVITVSALTPPIEKLVAPVRLTGTNPFSQRRQRARRLEGRTVKAPPFWCASFQKFRARFAT